VVGLGSLQHNTTGESNTAIGSTALNDNTTGSGNIAVGDDAGHALTTGDDNIDIGNLGVAGESGTLRIGAAGAQTRAFIAGIFGVTASGGTPVVINSSGQLGTATSSRRFKDEIKPMDNASEAILALQPVTFRYKKELDSTGAKQFGLIAEDVAKINPDLVVRDAEGKINTVRYDAVNAMLLNEFLKAHRLLEQQREEIDELKTESRQQAAQIQKLTAQMDVTNSANRLAGTAQ